MFYVLDGVVHMLSGTEIVRAEPGDLIVVPLGLPHAFSAGRGSGAEILIVIAPGVERFEYFRQLTRIAQGKQPPGAGKRSITLGDVRRFGPVYRRRCRAIKEQLLHAPI
jgi:quercetin dioxygenase-like cupin family protein